MKKILIVITFVLLLTGCRATVDVSIDKDKVTEKVSVREQNSTAYNEMKNWDGFPVTLYYDADLEAPLWMPNREKESGVAYYDVSMNDSEKTITATGNFSLSEYNRSSLVRNCFKLFNVITEGKTTIFSTSNGLICDFNNFDVVVNTPYTVTNSNATNVDSINNTYTWKVNNSNRDTVSIYLEVDFSKKYNESSSIVENDNSNASTKQEQKKNYLKIVLIIVVIIVLALAISILYFYKKNKKVSSI